MLTEGWHATKAGCFVKRHGWGLPIASFQQHASVTEAPGLVFQVRQDRSTDLLASKIPVDIHSLDFRG